MFQLSRSVRLGWPEASSQLVYICAYAGTSCAMNIWGERIHKFVKSYSCQNELESGIQGQIEGTEVPKILRYDLSLNILQIPIRSCNIPVFIPVVLASVF